MAENLADTNVGNIEYICKADAVNAMGKARWAKERLVDIKPADVAPVRHGKWIKEWWHGGGVSKCSTCSITQTVNVYDGVVKFKYCPYCGAKMEEDNDNS